MKSVNAAELQDAADRLVSMMRQDAMFRDVTSDAQLKGCRRR
jgi:HAE1 family hydrophobic/amphiphilic exporter-1